MKTVAPEELLTEIHDYINPIIEERDSIKQENVELKKRLAWHEQRFPKTYKGAKQYLEAYGHYYYLAAPRHVAYRLNELGFPAYQGTKWTEAKVQRAIESVFSKRKKVPLVVEVSPEPTR